MKTIKLQYLETEKTLSFLENNLLATDLGKTIVEYTGLTMNLLLPIYSFRTLSFCSLFACSNAR